MSTAGWQTEIPDFWLKLGNPWEVVRTDVKYPVRFYGNSRSYRDSNDHVKYVWEGGEVVLAVAHDTPIPGFRTPHTINLRLWSSEPTTEFDLRSFNEGNYFIVLITDAIISLFLLLM
jgi:starch phosphorylase